MSKDSKATTRGNAKYIRIPMLTFIIKYNIPMLAQCKYQIPPSSTFALGGDTKYLELFMRLFGHMTNREYGIHNDVAFLDEIMNKIKNRKDKKTSSEQDLREEVLKRIHNGTLYVPIQRRMRHDMLEYYDVKRAITYARINTSAAFLNDEIPTDHKQILHLGAVELNKAMSSPKLKKSEAAYINLKFNHGIDIPASLVLSRLNHEKLQQTYSAFQRDEHYWNTLDAFIDRQFASKHEGSLTWLCNEKMVLMDVVAVPFNDINDNQRMVSIISQIPPSPGAIYSKDYRVALSRRGNMKKNTHISISSLDSASRYEFLEEAKHAWVRIARDIINSKNIGLVNEVIDATGLNPAQADTFRRLVDGSSIGLGGVFSITVNNKESMCLSDDLNTILSNTAYIETEVGSSSVIRKSAQSYAIMMESIIGSATSQKIKYSFSQTWKSLVTSRRNVSVI